MARGWRDSEGNGGRSVLFWYRHLTLAGGSWQRVCQDPSAENSSPAWPLFGWKRLGGRKDDWIGRNERRTGVASIKTGRRSAAAEAALGPHGAQLHPGAPNADNSSILVVVLIGAGLAVGLILGRWWALFACAAVGVWVGMSAHLDEVPGWFLGLEYAALSGLGVAAGVLFRRQLARRS